MRGAHLGAPAHRELRSSRVVRPFHPIDSVSSACRINGDTSESLIGIDTSEVLFNGRIIEELDIFGVAAYNKINCTPSVTRFRNPVHKACYFGSHLELNFREVFGFANT